MDERERIAAFIAGARAAGAATAPVEGLGPGDDAAVFPARPDEDLVWSNDDQVEGVHFRRVWCGWAEIGGRAASAALSDLAAMGATPRGLLVALGIPSKLPLKNLHELGRGLGTVLAASDCPLLGGNVTRGPAGLRLSLSVLGAVPRGRAFLRSAGRAGDRLYVSGPLGWARLGLAWLEQGGDPADPELAPAVARFLGPRARLELGGPLRAAAGERVLAAMDLSDGLASDLPRLARASGLAAEIEAARLPAPPPELGARVEATPHALAWLGGEDYELLVAGPPALGAALPQLHPIGRLVSGEPGAVILRGAETAGEGFDHFGASPDGP